MSTLTRRQRLQKIFAGEVPDRPAVKLWGAAPGQHVKHPAYEPVRDTAVELADLTLPGASPFDLYCGRHAERLTETREEPTDDPAWVHRIGTYHTPEGPLRTVSWHSTRGRPGYVAEHLLKEPEDIRKLLSMPYEPYPFDADCYLAEDRRVGDAGIVIYGLSHAMYGLERMIGSENFALWSFDAENLMLEAMAVFAERIRAEAQRVIDAGLRPVFGWVGPELAIPPLMSVDHFRRYVYELDKPLIDMIHDAGGYVWVHCHGKMSPVIKLFAQMGVDVLNPIEPPPMGDVTLDEAFAMTGERMGLEGNIETHDLMTGTPALVREKIDAALASVKGQRRLILCPSSSYMENPQPPGQLIENLLCFVRYGVEAAERLATQPA
ncbi:MAG: uroporphyrinogen decarboxylase family protein [Phycisphaeraceae bacterium]